MSSLNTHFLAMTEFKIINTISSGMTYFLLCNSRHNFGSLLVLYCYFHGKFSNELYSLIPSLQTFVAITYYAMPMESNYLNSLDSNHKEEVSLSQLFSPRTATNKIFMDASLNTIILISSNQEPIIANPPYTHNFYFLHLHSY